MTSLRSIVRHIIWKCVKCFHQKGQSANLFMADLPRSRVQPSRVFSRVGTDYAGLFLIKPRRGRQKSTLIVIEACLNSRPLCPISEDPSEHSVLTPGHFIIGTALTTRPEENLLDEKISSLKRWPSNYFRVFGNGGPVNDNIPPLHWKLGRVTEVYPSADDKVRVVLVKTANGLLKRPILKLSVLTIEN
ncbi:hypothetical protein AVEN_3856-1 [Araneus ventricosus]|uniref:DUF5641 domain-containing protein n=1 Tax=Araneus ventricosus TaxID=182803 RepID=A0A4Y2VB06_ARAVE|nr:hypothetical protein AVEN_3856-1 [Araneus ventricosus]